ncbi:MULTISPECIES: sugar transferase [unclassified Sphingomonas]|uniref:sugar transferase n=1 Tax=unclassified Sphingomonas TaxID=196159 RepID=UPI00160BABD1|nr:MULTISPECIES: sugar transferase [unclassified Sphingomonas]MBB3346786.1 lipopolysaccharide/colanic/teichoic acid biosynthesis glycosyltransferase [Sphingomonas sp. BK069]MBB3472834.1 lipopolysaccharide/colanic/teichoic acid biosynthesis glycosyltransferase [Sphingomonas sp. BK345]
MTARRSVDIVVAAVGLVFVAPLLLLLALVQAAVAGRPILFVQARSGLAQRPFPLRKFRTMNDRRDAAGALLPDDQRLLPTGRFLRATRMDELPQLWNVLRGEMSLIGPRPLLPVTIAAAGEQGAARARVRPGLTGWAQVNGNTRLSEAEKLALDLWYIEHRGLRLDLEILFRTLLVAGGGGERRNADAIRSAYAGDPRRRG